MYSQFSFGEVYCCPLAYIVRNLVLPNMVIPILMHFNSLVSNLRVASHIKPHKGIHNPTKCDIINGVKLFPTVYYRIYCHNFLKLSNQKSRYKNKCIRIDFIL